MACASALMSVASCGSDPSTANADAAPSSDALDRGDATIDAGSPDEGAVVDAGVMHDDDPAETGVSTACVPATSCPPGVLCGRYTDPCSGAVFACGSACADGGVCLPAPGDPTTQTCQPKSCTGKCGTVKFDSCGVAIDCGGCTGGLACIGNQCTAATPSDAAASGCMAPTCTPDPMTTLCGTVSDGCGHTLSCKCAAGQDCIGGVCQAVPPECSLGDAGAKCGAVANACGSGTVACPGTCAGETKCESATGTCESCNPPSCGTATCGSLNNGCGPAVSCGTCSGPGAVCGLDGGCCTPRTCADADDAGAVNGCGVVDLGCGVKKSCRNCNTDERCLTNACVPCMTLTCADFDGGCGHTDTCGDSINCCAAGTFCQGKICCPAGFIQYQGTCCQPACDPDQPAGTQMSCGQAIYCPPLGAH
jgi:hypothetical protein